jgi:hypothetical protein
VRNVGSEATVSRTRKTYAVMEQKCITAHSSGRGAYSAAMIGRMQRGPQLECSASVIK